MFPPDEAGQLNGKVVAIGIQRFDRWKISSQVADDKLINMLRSNEIFEASFAHIAQRNIFGQIIANKFPGGQRDQHLPAMGGGHETLDACHGCIAFVSARLIVIIDCLRIAGMNPHADFDRCIPPILVVKIHLRLDGSAYCISRGVECYAECIANDLKDISVVRIHRGLQDGMMAFAQNLPFIGMFLSEFCTALDIGEKEGDSAGGEHELL
jgi:hypothetical protein